MADKLRAMSWDQDKGTLSVVLTNAKEETFCIELKREEVAKLLTHYQPRSITNHFGGDLSRAEDWLQTSRQIISDPSNREERPKPAKLPRFESGKRGTLKDAQTSSRIRMNGLWLLSTLKQMTKAKKVG